MLSPDQQQELLDSVVEEFTLRLRSGERPAIVEYKEKYPSLSEEIDELLTSVAMIEELKTQNPPTHGTLKREMKEILKLERIGDYRIVRELGRGGMGIVFEAVHESLGRRVAIKVMPNRTFDDQKYLERFRREAQAAANLHHTNIVSVFGIGQTGDHHYYVMEFVDGESVSTILSRLNQMNESLTQDGQSIETVIDAQPSQTDSKTTDSGLTVAAHNSTSTGQIFNTSHERVRWAAQMGAQIADGLAYAHALGVLHRDIKPSNLLVDRFETIWLTDFGLVKNLGNQTITKTGDIIGTPQYMSPESFEGLYDERSETYCLGLTLYEMATLKPAFENASTPELIRRITTTTPVAPRKIDRKIPRDLERIIEKSISKEPRYRYESAEAMREDLRAFLDDRPITARKISMVENVWRWSRRDPFAAGMSFVAALMLCLIAVTATIALYITKDALAEANQKQKTLEVEIRRADFNRMVLGDAVEFTHQSYDQMFRMKVLGEEHLDSDVNLDGFLNLDGISASIDESDAAFLENMLDYYLGFEKRDKKFTDAVNDIGLKELTASSLRRVANIYHLVGNFDEAIIAYDKSIAAYENLQRSNPKRIPDALNLVRTIKEKARALELNSLPAERKKSQAEYARAIKILREHENANDLQMQIELAKTLVTLSFPKLEMPYRIPKTFESLRKGYPLMFGRGSDTSIVCLIQNSRRRLQQSGRDLSPREKVQLQRLRRSNKLLNEASEIVEQLTKENKYNDEVIFVRAITLARWSIILRAKGDKEKASWAHKESTQNLQDLHDRKPDNAEYEFALAQNFAIPRYTRASEIESLEKAKEIMLLLSKRYDRNLDYKQFLGNLCVRLGILYRDSKKMQQAEHNLSLGYTTYQPLLPTTPRNRLIQVNGLIATLNYVDILNENGKSDDAVYVIEESIEALNTTLKSILESNKVAMVNNNQDGIEKNSGRTFEITDEERRREKSIRRIQKLYSMKQAFLYRALGIIHDDAGNTILGEEAREKANLILAEAPGMVRPSSRFQR